MGWSPEPALLPPPHAPPLFHSDAPVALKDGDIVTFGPESHAAATVERAADRDATTVEAFLLVEAERAAERVQARAEQLASGLRDEWRAARGALLAARRAGVAE